MYVCTEILFRKKYLSLLICLYTMHRRPNQSHYDATIARKEAIEIFWNDKSIRTEAILYLLEHNYISDIYNDSLFNQDSSLKEKQADARYLLRYMGREDY